MNEDDKDEAELIPDEAFATLYSGPVYLGHEVVRDPNAKLTVGPMFTFVGDNADAPNDGPFIHHALNEDGTCTCEVVEADEEKK
jgi:hypothetical protein